MRVSLIDIQPFTSHSVVIFGYFDVAGLSEKLDRVLELLEKVGLANPFNHHKPKRRIVYAKEACTIIGKSLSSLYRGIKAPYDPIPSYKRSKLLYFYEDELYAWIEGGRKHPTPQVSRIIRMP